MQNLKLLKKKNKMWTPSSKPTQKFRNSGVFQGIDSFLNQNGSLPKREGMKNKMLYIHMCVYILHPPAFFFWHVFPLSYFTSMEKK